MLPSEESHRALLQSIVDVARAIFGARASSIFLLDRETDELVFEAVSGEGEGDLIGMRIPVEHGDRGLGARHRPADRDRRPPAGPALRAPGGGAHGLRARGPDGGAARRTARRSLGVLQVLDRSKDRAFSLGEIDLLILFANQAAIGLDLLQTARRARAVAEQGEGSEAVVARIAALLGRAEDDVAGVRLLEALETVLARLAP